MDVKEEIAFALDGTIKLKRCPFCGGRPHDVPQNTGWVLRCGWCGARMVDERSKDHCYAAWNRRT